MSTLFRSKLAGGLLAALALALPAAAQDQPAIKTVSPNGGTLGTVVTITGTNFGENKPKVFLTEEGSTKKTNLKVLTNSATEITAELKSAKGGAGLYTLNVLPKGDGIEAATDAFTVLAPEIVGLDPGTAGPGEEIQVQATNVGNKTPKMKIGGKKAKVIAYQQGGVGEGVVDLLTIVVPKALANGPWDVLIANKIAEIIEAGAFVMTGSTVKLGKHGFQATINGNIAFKASGQSLQAEGNALAGCGVGASNGSGPTRTFAMNFPLSQEPPATFEGGFSSSLIFLYTETTLNGGIPTITSWSEALSDDFSLTFEAFSGGQVKASFTGTLALSLGTGDPTRQVEGSFIADFEEIPLR